MVPSRALSFRSGPQKVRDPASSTFAGPRIVRALASSVARDIMRYERSSRPRSGAQAASGLGWTAARSNFAKLRTARRGSHGSELLAVIELQTPVCAPHSRVRLFQYRIEYRGEIAGRGVDDLQYFGGRGLLLQCLARLGDQPRILHRDDRLRREILQQRDLLVGERPHFPAIDGMTPSSASSLRSGTISSVRTPPIADRAAGSSGFSVEARRMTRRCGQRARRARLRRWMPVAVRTPCRVLVERLLARRASRRDENARRHRSTGRQSGIAEAVRLFQHRVEHRREVAGRGIDDLQYLGGRGLLLQCLARLGQEPRVLHRDDRLRREFLQQRDLPFREWPYFMTVRKNYTEERSVFSQRHISVVRAPVTSITSRDMRLYRGLIARGIGDLHEGFAPHDPFEHSTRCRRAELRSRNHSANRGLPRVATGWKSSPSYVHRLPWAAPQRRCAFPILRRTPGRGRRASC